VSFDGIRFGRMFLRKGFRLIDYALLRGLWTHPLSVEILTAVKLLILTCGFLWRDFCIVVLDEAFHNLKHLSLRYKIVLVFAQGLPSVGALNLPGGVEGS
jgi:hypothetical protein